MNKFYVTTSIAYINGEPHIGYGQEVLAADVVARYHREIKADNTFYLTGADEHGLSVQVHADRAGMDAQKFVDTLVGKFQGLKEQLNLTNDYFIRTTSEEHQKTAKDIWNKVLENGYIYKKKYSGTYCVGCEAMVNKKDLINGRCPNHPNLIPEEIEEENWFFKLSAFQDKLLNYYEEHPRFVQPQERYNEIKSLVKTGLEDVSISRPKEKLSWGIEVPNDPNHVMYVWFDALTNYLYPRDFWPADLHIIGKDILRFHAALWPAMLLAAGFAEEQLPKKIHVHGFISIEGQKMSKTLGNVIKPSDLVEKFGLEATRFLLLRELSFDKDSDFSWERMKARYNADLANDLGNLLQRTLTMVNKYGVKCSNHTGGLIQCVDEYIDKLDFNGYLMEVWKMIQEMNKLIDESKPWVLAKTDREKLTEVLCKVIEALGVVANSLEPIMPDTAVKIKTQLKTLQPEPLFPRID